MPDSEALRAKLRAAERAVQDALDLTDGTDDDRQAAKELADARDTVAKWTDALERGLWPGRAVPTYPTGGERISDGT